MPEIGTMQQINSEPLRTATVLTPQSQAEQYAREAQQSAAQAAQSATDAQTAAASAQQAVAGAVKYSEAQTLTAAQQAQARANIGAGDAEGNIISDELKAALLQLASKIAYIDTNGKDYYDDLYDALYPQANLISIAAVFTQGKATIYNTDSIDSLKQHLLVTAYYDDGTSSVLPANNYTLNGSLVVGSSIITASYNGKADNFNVMVTDSSLPAGYIKHDYIYNTERTRYSTIDTGLSPQYNGVGYEHSIEFMITVNMRTAADALYGLRERTGSDPKSRALWAIFRSNHNQIAMNYGGTDSSYIKTIELNTRYKCTTKNGAWYIDDTLVMDNMDTGSYIEPSSGTITIFGISTGTNKGAYFIEGTRIYGFKVIDSSDGGLIADLVPCVNSNNVAGLYDRIRRAFYTAEQESNVKAGDDA